MAPLEETEDDDLPSSPASSSTSSTWLGNVTLAWQEKLFSPCEENYYRRAKEEDFQGKASQENRSNQVCRKYMDFRIDFKFFERSPATILKLLIFCDCFLYYHRSKEL